MSLLTHHIKIATLQLYSCYITLRHFITHYSNTYQKYMQVPVVYHISMNVKIVMYKICWFT